MLEPERLHLIKEAGFDAVSAWWEDEEGTPGIKKEHFPTLARDSGLILENIHVPLNNTKKKGPKTFIAKAFIIAGLCCRIAFPTWFWRLVLLSIYVVSAETHPGLEVSLLLFLVIMQDALLIAEGESNIIN